MAGRARRDIIETRLDGVRRATACVSNQPVHLVGGRHLSPSLSVSFVPLERPVSLRTTGNLGPVLFAFKSDLEIAAIGQNRGTTVIQTTAYSYRILDRGEQEVLAYHWHPHGPSDVTYPHLHLSHRVPPIPNERAGSFALAEMHLPTGFVSLADVVRLLIAEFGVEPRRQDWKAILNG